MHYVLIAGHGSKYAPPPTAYTTTFPLTENPISESGVWTNYGNGFTDVRTTGGRSMATNGVSNTYDDSAALYNAWTGGNNYRVGAHLYRDPAINTAFNHEVAIQLRASISGAAAHSFEVLFNALGGVDIESWDGAGGGAGFFTEVLAYSGSALTLVTGDYLEASIVGNLISVYYNSSLLYTATSSLHPTGQPGQSFFLRPGATAAHFCFEDWRVDAL